MDDFLTFLLLAAAVSLSVYVSLPIVYSKRAQGRWATGLNAAAIGILIFLLADIFSDVAPILYSGGYVADPFYSLAFGAAFVGAFLGLFVVDNLSSGGGRESTARSTAFIIAVGIGLQNLTEGLVFGVNWAAGIIGVVAVLFVGFFLQNVSEGFPIAAPFLGTKERRGLPLMLGLFFLSGIPTFIGALIGYTWSSTLFILVFDALAIGAIGYAILPMLRIAFRPLQDREASIRRNHLVYLGVMVGFVIGFAVNSI
jgi:zinc transporter, ZIP family